MIALGLIHELLDTRGQKRIKTDREIVAKWNEIKAMATGRAALCIVDRFAKKTRRAKKLRARVGAKVTHVVN
jgi:hypothetical protein